MLSMHKGMRPVEAIAQQVKERRKARGWSAQRLADEMKAVGIPWQRSTVANLENGRRPVVGVDELLALAVVLGVNPVLLLVPLDLADDEPYSVAGNTTTAGRVREWVSGQDLLVKPRTLVELARALQPLPPEIAAKLNEKYRTWDWDQVKREGARMRAQNQRPDPTTGLTIFDTPDPVTGLTMSDNADE